MARNAKNYPAAIDIPAQPGTYVLLLQLDTAFEGVVGRLGDIVLPVGFYAYVGSAHGSGGLRARVLRHLRVEKRHHWHIDALANGHSISEVWLVISPERLECRWSRQLESLSGVEVPVPGFGSSDCDCQTHLYAIPESLLNGVWESLGQPERLGIG
jgi:Uri superfamily endonuclease